MSEPYSIILDYVVNQAVLLDKNPSAPFRDRTQAVAIAALIERLEELVKVLEQIRDRLPGQIAK